MTFQAPPTQHVDILEELALRFEREEKAQTALDCYRLALSREGEATPRGQRFKAKVTDLESVTRRKSPSVATSRWRGLVIGVLCLLAGVALGLGVSWVRTRTTSANLNELPSPPPVSDPAAKDHAVEQARAVVTDHFRYISAHKWEVANSIRTDDWLREHGLSDLEKRYSNSGPVTIAVNKLTPIRDDYVSLEVTAAIAGPRARSEVLLFGVIRDPTSGQWKINDEQAVR